MCYIYINVLASIVSPNTFSLSPNVSQPPCVSFKCIVEHLQLWNSLKRLFDPFCVTCVFIKENQYLWVQVPFIKYISEIMVSYAVWHWDILNRRLITLFHIYWLEEMALYSERACIRNFMWYSIESVKCMSKIGTHYYLIQSLRSQKSDKVFDSFVLYEISTIYKSQRSIN